MNKFCSIRRRHEFDLKLRERQNIWTKIDVEKMCHDQCAEPILCDALVWHVRLDRSIRNGNIPLFWPALGLSELFFSQHHFTAFIQFDADYCICYMLWVFVIWYGISFDLSQLINKIYWISMKRWKLFFFFTHLADSTRGYLIGKKRLQRSDKFWEKKTPLFPYKMIFD